MPRVKIIDGHAEIGDADAVDQAEDQAAEDAERDGEGGAHGPQPTRRSTSCRRR